MKHDNCGLPLWVTETHQNSVSLSFRVEKTLFSGQSPWQRVDVVKTAGHGVMLLNDGLIMLSERDEFIYHEMIAHVPLFVHPSPRRILVIGGGDGGTVREIMRHPGVERVVMVEIDEMVVNVCKKYLPDVSCALDDTRLELKIGDGVRFVAETTERFYIIMVDSTDPVGPAKPLFDKAFYKNAAKALTDDGILISQAESPFYNHDIQLPMLANQRPFFKKLHVYLFSNLTYPGGLWTFGFASKKLCPVQDFLPDRVADAGIQTRYYTPDIHRSAFVLPAFMKKNLSGIIDRVDLGYC